MTDPKVKEFIEYCKEHYSDKIEEITLKLHEEHKDWQITVKEIMPGLIWVPWFIPTSDKVVMEGNVDMDKYKVDASKFKKLEGNDTEKS